MRRASDIDQKRPDRPSVSRYEVVVLDGTPSAEHAGLLDALVETYRQDGAHVRVFTLRELTLTHCRGCFGCWLETPGLCVHEDIGREIVGAVVGSHTTVWFTPITFGGLSSELKRLVDRFVPIILPFFTRVRGETHHSRRYPRYPRLVGVGILPGRDDDSERIFRVLIGRNALNFHAPTHAAEVVHTTEDLDAVRARFRDLLVRSDEVPLEPALAVLHSAPDGAAFEAAPGRERHALLVVGSPKDRKPSTSGVLGSYLLERLGEQGWRGESITLRARVLDLKRRPALLAAIDRADLVVLAFPLYIDALPFLVTRLLEIVAAHRAGAPDREPQRLVAICNNGFPEAHHNLPALAICARFAAAAGFEWAGGLALGAGEALCSGRPLAATPGAGELPVGHVMRALDLTAAAVTAGQPVPEDAARLLRGSPVPRLPVIVWRWIFAPFGDAHWRQQAAGNGVRGRAMLDRPYAAH